MLPQTNLKGSQTTVTGIISIIFGALGIFTQIWNSVHGGQIDPTVVLGSTATITSGAGLIKAADSKQTDNKQ